MSDEYKKWLPPGKTARRYLTVPGRGVDPDGYQAIQDRPNRCEREEVPYSVYSSFGMRPEMCDSESEYVTYRETGVREEWHRQSRMMTEMRGMPCQWEPPRLSAIQMRLYKHKPLPPAYSSSGIPPWKRLEFNTFEEQTSEERREWPQSSRMMTEMRQVACRSETPKLSAMQMRLYKPKLLPQVSRSPEMEPSRNREFSPFEDNTSEYERFCPKDTSSKIEPSTSQGSNTSEGETSSDQTQFLVKHTRTRYEFFVCKNKRKEFPPPTGIEATTRMKSPGDPCTLQAVQDRLNGEQITTKTRRMSGRGRFLQKNQAYQERTNKFGKHMGLPPSVDCSPEMRISDDRRSNSLQAETNEYRRLLSVNTLSGMEPSAGEGFNITEGRTREIRKHMGMLLLDCSSETTIPADPRSNSLQNGFEDATIGEFPTLSGMTETRRMTAGRGRGDPRGFKASVQDTLNKCETSLPPSEITETRRMMGRSRNEPARLQAIQARLNKRELNELSSGNGSSRGRGFYKSNSFGNATHGVPKEWSAAALSGTTEAGKWMAGRGQMDLKRPDIIQYGLNGGQIGLREQWELPRWSTYSRPHTSGMGISTAHFLHVITKGEHKVLPPPPGIAEFSGRTSGRTMYRIPEEPISTFQAVQDWVNNCIEPNELSPVNSPTRSLFSSPENRMTGPDGERKR